MMKKRGLTALVFLGFVQFSLLPNAINSNTVLQKVEAEKKEQQKNEERFRHLLDAGVFG